MHVYSSLEYSIIPGYGPGDMSLFWKEGIFPEEMKLFFKYLRELIGDAMMIGFHGDGTFSIPDGNSMYDFAYAIADDPDGVKARAESMAQAAIKRNKVLRENGVDCLFLCSDYC